MMESSSCAEIRSHKAIHCCIQNLLAIKAGKDEAKYTLPKILPHLLELGWRKSQDVSYKEVALIYIAPWADYPPFERCKCDVLKARLQLNRDYWVDPKKLLDYGQNYGFLKSSTPATPDNDNDSNRRSSSESWTTTESIYSLIDDGFRPDYQALRAIVVAGGSSVLNLGNAGQLFRKLCEVNPRWHWIYAGLATVYCRTHEIETKKDLDNFEEGSDYFMGEDDLMAFVHGQFEAHGDVAFLTSSNRVPKSLIGQQHIVAKVACTKRVQQHRVKDVFEKRKLLPYRGLKGNHSDPAVNLYSLESETFSPPSPPPQSSSRAVRPMPLSASPNRSQLQSKSSSVSAPVAVAVAVPAAESRPIAPHITLRETIKCARVLLDVKNNPVPTERTKEITSIRSLITKSLCILSIGQERGNVADMKEAADLNNVYVCGLPGFGKTLSVEQLLLDMTEEQEQEQSASDSLPSFNVVKLQGTAVSSESFYQAVAAKLGMRELGNGTGVGSAGEVAARERVLSRFKNTRQCQGSARAPSKGPDPITILMIDEIDKAPRKQVTELLEIMASATCSAISDSPWACALVVVGIANDLRFCNTVGVSHRAQKHMSVVPFEPYRPEELHSILARRSLGVFDEKAMRLMAGRGFRAEKGESTLCCFLLCCVVQSYVVSDCMVVCLLVVYCKVPYYT
jgi:Cdc6-like AAA superfamily ATPase